MTRREKRLARIRNNPKDVTFEELCRLYQDFGFTIKSGGKGSHFIARHPVLNIRRGFPRQNPMKVTYILEAVEAVDLTERSGLE